MSHSPSPRSLTVATMLPRQAMLIIATAAALASPLQAAEPLKLDWSSNYLTISGEQIPGREIKILYLEAYCRDNAHTTDWGQHTVVGHKTSLLEKSKDGTRLRLRCVLSDGVTVEHVITSTHDEVDFRLTAHNPTSTRSEAHWAQPCTRVGAFTGLGDPNNPRTYEYLSKSFVFLDGNVTRMPTPDWATEARYIPGQVWRAPGVKGADVNPRPLNPRLPSNGLIGCFSHDEKQILAMAWSPYHELFQGVITCLHSDFRLGGLQPDQKLKIHGKLYIVPADVDGLLKRYQRDFPDLVKLHAQAAEKPAASR